ncbi:class I tRNA ligase family protein [Cupriavidus basilensis]
MRASSQGREEVRAARRPAVRQWRHPHRTRRQQGPQGHDRQGARLTGLDAVYVPGWDCHGMPIEIQIEKQFGKGLPVQEVQAKARAYASRGRSSARMVDFERLGVLGDWDHPYLTMNYSNEADELRALGKIMEKGYAFRGLKPVNWCFDCALGAGRGRGRVQGQGRPVDRRGLPVRRDRQARACVQAFDRADQRQARLDRDLDHHAVDDPEQPGAQRAPGSGVRAGRLRRAAT